MKLMMNLDSCFEMPILYMVQQFNKDINVVVNTTWLNMFVTDVYEWNSHHGL